MCQGNAINDNYTKENLVKEDELIEEEDKGRELFVDQMFSLTSSSSSSSVPSNRRSLRRDDDDDEERSSFFSHSTKLGKDDTTKVFKAARRRLRKTNWKVLLHNDDYDGSDDRVVVTFVHQSEVELGECLGRGSFSSVYVARNYLPKVVVKVLREKLVHKPETFAACAVNLVKEAVLLNLLRGESNIVQIHGCQKNGLSSYQNGRHDSFFLLLERLDYTLDFKIKEWTKERDSLNTFLSFTRSSDRQRKKKLHLLDERLRVIKHIIKGIANLHKHGIIHRDLKPANIGYCTIDDQWKIFDLDVAKLVPASQGYSKDFPLVTKRVGSPKYMAPECAKGEPYNCSVDVYSFALLVHFLLTLEMPYCDISAQMHDEMVFHNQLRPNINQKWPESVKTFLECTWHKDWRNRPNLITFTGMDLILHDFVKYKTVCYNNNQIPAKLFSRGKTKRQAIIPKETTDAETSTNPGTATSSSQITPLDL